jgi:ribonuclease D
VENLLSPDALRRLVWDPPPDSNVETVAKVLRGHGARDWQVALTAPVVSAALAEVAAKVAAATQYPPGDA